MKRFLSSNEIKAVLNISDCELMHQRVGGQLTFEKSGNGFFYSLPSSASILAHPLGQQLLNWHITKHKLAVANMPKDPETKRALEKLIWDILLPIERQFSRPTITYGFTALELHKVISKHFPAGTAPSLDQHAASEKNSADSYICKRSGAACDFIVANVKSTELIKFITEKLDYDRIYFYGTDRPIHVSVTLGMPKRHLQVMCTSDNGRRYPARKAFGEAAKDLAASL
ncbi:hypothetical protein [Alteromonas aestuariivivens]|uniref:hypothetical protein n=1 Tax=Alteromonas aestuariivivens TaxID=1938339 RepID=UPI0011C04A35|nr:hypothetical protein [Alteromonas aestuariivivens]